MSSYDKLTSASAPVLGSGSGSGLSSYSTGSTQDAPTRLMIDMSYKASAFHENQVRNIRRVLLYCLAIEQGKNKKLPSQLSVHRIVIFLYFILSRLSKTLREWRKLWVARIFHKYMLQKRYFQSFKRVNHGQVSCEAAVNSWGSSPRLGLNGGIKADKTLYSCTVP